MFSSWKLCLCLHNISALQSIMVKYNYIEIVFDTITYLGGFMVVEELVFVSIVHRHKNSETNLLLLIESIRRFAGSLVNTPIWVFTPDKPEKLSPKLTTKLNESNVTLIPFKINTAVRKFFFASEVEAVSLAETRALKQTKLLAWLDSNTLVLQEPSKCLIPDERSLGYRPVHHTNIGLRLDKPIDPFWTEVFRACHVTQDRIFPMTTHVDAAQIRPYFNAGFLITRPERRLFKKWHDTFFDLYQKPVFQAFYKKSRRYWIFMHQAILSGVILASYSKDEIQELPPTYNYPLHLLAKDVSEHAPSSLEGLVTIRHEVFYRDPNWSSKMPAPESLKTWIAKQLYTM
ncbi:MAG: hypothetical protein ACFFDP_10030 [Promethearchaeota archaeon]